MTDGYKKEFSSFCKRKKHTRQQKKKFVKFGYAIGLHG
jgi:hypothetical protein